MKNNLRLAVCSLLGLVLLSFVSCKTTPTSGETLSGSSSVVTESVTMTIAKTTSSEQASVISTTVPNTTSQAVATTRKPATTVPATTVPKAIGGLVNTIPEKIADEELIAFFNANRELLESIAAQMIPLRDEIDLHVIRKPNSSIEAYDSDGDAIDVSHLKASLRQQLEQYFSAAGNANESWVWLQEQYERGNIVVEFNFRLGRADGHFKGIRYSPEFHEDYWPVLDDNWYIYEFYGI
jgi:hypothetical protein